ARRFEAPRNDARRSSSRSLTERRTQPARELERVIIGPEVHEEETRLLNEHVAMQGGDLDSVLPQRLDYGIDLDVEQNEVAGYGGLAAACRLKIDRGSYTQGAGWIELRAVFADHAASRHRHLIHASVRLSLGADDLIDLSRVKIDCWL